MRVPSPRRLRSVPLVLCLGVLSPASLAAQAAWSGRTYSPSPLQRLEHVMAYDLLRGRTVLFGGRGSGYLNDTWEWDGSRWQQLSPAVSPPARSNHALAYDLFRGRVVLFSGNNLAADTWLWDGSTWQQRNPTTSPSARQIHAMVFDLTRGRTVLFGGNASGTLQNDTWEWDGANWNPMNPANRPPPRWGHRMAYDPIRRQVLLYGGNAGSSRTTLLGDTWVYDGVNWTQRSPATNPPRQSDATLVWDALRERVVMFGGTDTVGFSNDTWEWDGIDWLRRTPANPPSNRCCHAMVYDEILEQTVMFGGYPSDPGTYLYRTTTPARFSITGVGCPGAGGVPVIESKNLPWTGDPFQLDLRAIGTGATPGLIVGLSDSTWSGGALPFDLGPIGFPGCALRASLDLTLFGLTQVSATIPSQPQLGGVRVFFQAVSLGPGTRLGISGLATARIGVR